MTNQRGIDVGRVHLEDLEEMHRRMDSKISKHGAIVTDVYFCLHNISEHCSCWKPKSSMLLQAAEDHALDVFTPWMIGDAASDIEAGMKAGCKTDWILPAAAPQRIDLQADLRVHNVAARGLENPTSSGGIVERGRNLRKHFP